MRFVGFEVLVAVIKLHVASGCGFEGLAVVFDVVGAKTCIPVVNVHVAVGGGDVAFAALRFGFQIGDAAFAGRKAGLLCRGHARRRGGEPEEQRSQEKKRAKRDISPCMGITVHSEHAVIENSWIA
jgi:hypothetical protein